MNKWGKQSLAHLHKDQLSRLCHITVRDYTTIKKLTVKKTPPFIHTCCRKEPQGSRSPVSRAQFTLQRAMLPHRSHLKSGSFWDCWQTNGAIPTESITENITIQIFCAECMHSSPGPSAFGWSKALAWLISNCSRVLLTCKLLGPPQSSGFSSQIDRHHTYSVLQNTIPWWEGLLFHKHWNHYTKQFTS